MRSSRLIDVARVPGVRRLLGFALLAELPAGMTGLAVLLRITGSGGSYARGGLISAMGAVGVGICAPLWSRLIDRRGQAIALLPTAGAVAGAAVALALLPPRGSVLPLLAAALVMGLVQPPALVSARTLWPTVVTDPALLETTYSIESGLTELVFIVGPLLTVGINGLLGSAAALIASGALACIGALGVATSRASRGTRHRARAVVDVPRKLLGALGNSGVRTIVVNAMIIVAGFAAIDVSTVAVARHLGGNGMAGLMIAIWSLGSLVGGLAFGTRSWPGTLLRKVLLLQVGILVFTAALVPLHNLVALGAVLFIGGLNYAPSFSCTNQLVQKIADRSIATESFAWLTSGAVIGAAVGSAIGGLSVTHGGTTAGYGVAASAVAISVLVLLAGRRTLRAVAPSGPRTAPTAGNSLGEVRSDPTNFLHSTGEERP